MSGSGIFKDQASVRLVRQIFFAGEIRDWQLAIPDFGVVEGPFQVTALEIYRQPQWRGELRPGAGIGRPAHLRGGVMAVNRRRGEIAAMLDGREYRLCLTLGALAGTGGRLRRRGSGALGSASRPAGCRRATDSHPRAGLGAGGNAVSEDEVAGDALRGRAAGFARIVSDLLSTSFGAAAGRPPAQTLEQAGGAGRSLSHGIA